MSSEYVDVSNLKRKIRKLKKLETIIRFSSEKRTKAFLVWDDFFDLHEEPKGKAKYTLNVLAAMSHEEYRSVIDEYFALVYYELYKEDEITIVKTYDPAILAQLNLPFNADEKDIKRRFRELVKEYHPDIGGKSENFIELMKVYEKLLGR